MAGIPGFVGFSLDEDISSSLDKRQNGCFKCDNTSPVCPDCSDGELCQFTVQSCNECPRAFCAADPEAVTASPQASSGPNVGAIVGGIIGGLAAITILTYLVWRFCIKNKRAQYEPEQWQGDVEHTKEGVENDFASRRSQRASTHTVHSIASTVLTRASNIIQIAYIPGVTNRATPTSPTLLVPPVPPIPIAHSDGGSPSPFDEQHFFVPGDLRDSTYSGISGYSDRTSYARTSYAPRSSVASTIYGKNAIVSPLPAQKGNFLKPSIVSVKSRAASSNSGSSTPPVPVVDYEKYDQPPPSPAFSIGATFFKNASASTATAVRPQMVRVGSGPKTIEVKAKLPTTAGDGPSSPETLVRVSESDKEQELNAVIIIDDTSNGERSPFADPPQRGHKSNSSLSAVIGESARRAADNKRRTSADRDSSPFGDENAVRD
ncbi:overproduction-induced pheromone-resistant [Parahypoxylon ruwenzoriense]